MKIKTMSLICALTLALTLFYSQAVYAASTLSLLTSGTGGFSLQGVGMEDVSALDITITYDASTLSNPRVTKGGLLSSALVAINPNVPGIVRMGIVTTTPIKGDIIIATLVFDLVGDSPGRIIAIKANITNNKGISLPVQAQIDNVPIEPASVAPSNVGTQSGTTAAPATPNVGRQIMIGGGIVPSDDSSATAKNEPAPTPEEMPEPEKENVVVAQETARPETGTTVPPVQPTAQKIKKAYSQKSVLSRFHDFKGERSVKALTELFNQDPLIGFRQDPPSSLADGKATIKVFFIAAPGREKPELKIAGAALLSLRKDPDYTNTWIAELRPDRNAVSATLIVDQKNVNMVFQVVVAPEADIDLDKSGTVTEVDFKFFLHDRGTAKKPHFDLNNDGKRDYVDDYIFTANYIVQKQRETKPQINKKLK